MMGPATAASKRTGCRSILPLGRVGATRSDMPLVNAKGSEPGQSNWKERIGRRIRTQRTNRGHCRASATGVLILTGAIDIAAIRACFEAPEPVLDEKSGLAQFEHINAEVKAFQAAGDPVISVDTRRRNALATSRTAAVRCVRRDSRAGPGA